MKKRVKSAREYWQYGIDKKRFIVILNTMLEADTKELHILANKADDLIAPYLVESIKKNRSFDHLEALYGVLPTSKSDFYRKRRLLFHLVDVELKSKD